MRTSPAARRTTAAVVNVDGLHSPPGEEKATPVSGVPACHLHGTDVGGDHVAGDRRGAMLA